MVALDGEWEFHWRKLLSPSDFSGPGPPAPDAYLSVPGIWNGTLIGGAAIDGRGYATYRLKVRLGGATGDLGFKLLDAATAYRMWVNGVPVASNGAVGESPETAWPQYLPVVVRIPGHAVAGDAGPRELDIVIQVSNWIHRKGGLWESVRLGRFDQVISSREISVALTFFLSGVIIIMGLYHLGLYLLRREEIATLLFAVLALFMSMRSLIINDRIFVHWFPSIPWTWLTSVEYITAYCYIVVIAMFVRALYGEELTRRAMIVIGSIGTLYGIIFIVSNIGFFSRFKPAFDIYVLLGGLYVIYSLGRSSMKKREGAWIALGGMSALYFTGINDVLYNAQIINTTNIAPVGLFIYILSQSHLLSRRFASAMKSVERMSGQLADLNVNLERKVLERTEELQAAFEELEAMNDQLVETQNAMMGELELARRIQRQLIPQATPANFRICAHYLPMELVGGDFFDYIHFREQNRIGIFLSDVSGHGVPAALITSMMKSFILEAGAKKESPAQMLGYLNENLKMYAGGNFITAFYCIYDSGSRTIVYSNAGHNPPLIVSGGAVSHLDQVKTVPLGIMTNEEIERRGKQFRDCAVRAEENSRLFLYTDGLTDVQSEEDPSVYFGDTVLTDFISGSVRLAPQDLVYELMKKLREFQRHDHFKDDICVICMDL